MLLTSNKCTMRNQDFGMDQNIQFVNLCYSSPLEKGNKEKKLILKNINGTFYHGHITAILGPSGAGKSSLLNILTGFKTAGVTGSILVNGKERNLKYFKKQSCYIVQDIMLLPLLTVKECLEVAANLKLEASIGKQQKNVLISEVMDVLGLEAVSKTLVCKLSGGEKKRLSIGLELLKHPPFMFVDEPTSGLDSASAFQVISHLKMLAKRGQTVVCSIHQPSSRLFEMFDDAYLLAEGQCLYSGTLKDMTNILGELGFQCPNFYNRADFVIEIACGLRGDNKENLISKFGSIITEDNNINEESSLLGSEAGKQIEASIQVMEVDEGANLKLTYPVSTWRQFQVLFKRSFLCFKRDLISVQLRLLVHFLVGILIGVLYYDIGNEASKALSNVSFLFFIILFLFAANSALTVLSVPKEIKVIMQENLNNWYSMDAYFLSKVLSDIPIMIVCIALLIIPAYYLTGQHSDGLRVAQFWLISLISLLIAQGYGMLFGIMFQYPDLGLFMIPATYIPMILFSGFFLQLQDIPHWLKWGAHLSFFRYSFEGSMQCIYGYGRERMNCLEAFCYFKSPLKILEQFNMVDAVYEYDVLVLVIWYISLLIAIFFVLRWRISSSNN